MLPYITVVHRTCKSLLKTAVTVHVGRSKKDKVYFVACHESPEGEQMYSTNL
jgi:hypothetical protein